MVMFDLFWLQSVMFGIFFPQKNSWNQLNNWKKSSLSKHITINFNRCSRLIDIKSVRSITYDFFILRAMVFKPTDSTFLVSSQLTMSIHWPCYCTVHVYVHSYWWYRVCDFFSGSKSVHVFYRLFIYVLLLEIQLSRGGGWDPINRLNPATFLCLAQHRIWISNIIYRGSSFFCWVS